MDGAALPGPEVPPAGAVPQAASSVLRAWGRYADAQDAADQAREAVANPDGAEYERFWRLQYAAGEAFGVYRQEFALALEDVRGPDRQAVAARLLEAVAEALRRRTLPLALASVTGAIGDINGRIGYPARFAAPSPGHLTHEYAPREGVTVEGGPRDGTRRMRIAGSLVGIVSVAWTGSSATCLLPHLLADDLRLFNCASGSALNGLQLHVLTAHVPGTDRPPGLPARVLSVPPEERWPGASR